MVRCSILTFVTIVLLPFLTLGGCAGKKASEEFILPATSASAEIAGGTLTAVSFEEKKESVAAAQEKTTEAPEGIRFKTVYFDYDSSSLTAVARRTLEEHAAWLKSNPRLKVTIEGHCDERGSDEYNFALGESRALAIRNYLTGLGVAADQLGTISFGEERPAVAGHTEMAWAQNRRSEFK